MASNSKVVYGLTREGFTRKRLPDIIASLQTRIEDKLGVKIQTGPNSVFGQINGVYAFEIADLWEMGEDVYNAMYPNTANGASLSNAAGLAGIEQVGAEQTTLYITCTGKSGFIMPVGATVASKQDPTVTYSVRTKGQTIENTRANSVSWTVDETALTAGDQVGFEIDAVDFKHTFATGETKQQILSAVATLITAKRPDIDANIKNGVLVLNRDNMNEYFEYMAFGGTVESLSSPIQFFCDKYGSYTPKIGDLTQIVTSYPEWTAASNDRDSTPGRDAETDNALRQRWNASLYDNAAAMVEAIAAGVYKNVPGVTMALCYENPTGAVDADGRLPHSIEVIVQGGEPIAIAKEIWRTKGGGIDTNGTVIETIHDSQGIPHDIHFNRPTERKIYMSIKVHVNPEEVFPAAAIDDIRRAVLAKGQSSKVGEDIILQKYYATVFSATTGVGQIEIKAAEEDPATPGTAPADTAYTDTNVIIGVRELAVFDVSRISVVKV